MMIRMLALQAFPYAGRRLIAGQRFDCRGESDARLLEALKRAMRDPAAGLPTPRPDLVTNRVVIITTDLARAEFRDPGLFTVSLVAQGGEPLQNPDIVESGSGPLLETAGDTLTDPDTLPEQTTEAAQVVEHPEGAEDGSGDAEGSSLPGDQAETGTPAAKKAKRTYTRRTPSPEKAE